LDWLNKLERKIGRFAIPNLIAYLIAGYIIGFVIELVNRDMIRLLTLQPAYILQGQVWRIISWVLIPPPLGHPIFIIIMVFLYYSLGRTLERAWGTFRFNLYLFSGIFFTVLGSFLLFFLLGGAVFGGNLFSTHFINMSIFLAFAVSFPNMELRLYFVLPVKVKWLGLIFGLILCFNFIVGNMVDRVSIAASLLNFLLFFIFTMRSSSLNPKQQVRKAKFHKESKSPPRRPGVTAHRCAACGRTEQDDPNLEFRYCSKCNGNLEYCQDHLFTHEHK